MRKRIIGMQSAPEGGSAEAWLDLNPIAEVEVTSESPEHPIDAAFSSDDRTGWKAGASGTQTIRLIFKPAQSIRRIRLEFVEREVERSQEFVLHYSEGNGLALREALRQQWTFSPRGSNVEIEDYSVDLRRVRILQLTIDPDRGKGWTIATLNRWRIA